MKLLCHHRDRPGSPPLRPELAEKHRSYADRHAEAMIARGPTFPDDGDTPTGGVPIVDRPDPATARAHAGEFGGRR